MDRLIYFDNGATTYPKPPGVSEAVKQCIDTVGGNPGRGSHPLAVSASELIYACRESVGRMFGCEPEGVVFTYSATHALNMAIKGLVKRGDHVLISGMSHNAVFRPVFALAERGEITFDIYPHRPFADDAEILSGIRRLIRPETALVISCHMSNICSDTEPVEKIGALCRKRGIRFVVDGAQSGGHLPIDVNKMNITALCLPGHKGLFGIQGIGVLACGKDFPTENCKTIIEGGSGIHSLDPGMPEFLPERLEAGTPGTPAIAGLLAGLDWVRRVGINEIHRRCSALSSYFCDALSDFSDCTVYGKGDGGVVSFNIDGFSPSEVGAYLSERGICVRTGYHCAPLAHKSVGSFEAGSVRVSFSWWNRLNEVDRLLEVMKKL
ncbi:MAG: aminotransferase class V-fold PLP-dependent enzyme [Ruminococcaceae bacterium]|nr:aminotransferase class V-fold PLP-dependent enzyme [Oscillospiraceae bacterium]